MSEKEEVNTDEESVSLKDLNKNSSEKKSQAKQKGKKTKKSNTAAEPASSNSTTQDEDNEKVEKSKPRKKSRFYVEIDEADDKVPLLDQPAVIEGSRQRRTIMEFNAKVEVSKHRAIQIPHGKGVPLGRIPIINSRFQRLRPDEVKLLHRLLFGKLGNLSYLNSNIQKFNGFTFTKDSPEYTRKLTILGKTQVSILREFSFFFDLDLKIKKKKDVAEAILDFLLCPKRSEVTINPGIVSHPKRKATKRNYYERELDDLDSRKQKKTKANKAKKNESTSENDEASKKATEAEKKSDKVEDDESKENNAGADNTSELKKPAKKRKRNQVIEEQTETPEDNKSKKTKSKDTNDESAINNELDAEINPTENLSDDDLKEFLKKVLADANLEKTTMKTVYSLISKHYPNYNFTKKKDFIKEVVKSLIQT